MTLGPCSNVPVLILNREGNCEPHCVEQTECVLLVHCVTATVCLHSVPRCKLLCSLSCSKHVRLEWGLVFAEAELSSHCREYLDTSEFLSTAAYSFSFRMSQCSCSHSRGELLGSDSAPWLIECLTEVSLRCSKSIIQTIQALLKTCPYSLTPWCRVLPEQLTGLHLVKKFPAFHGTRRFITALTNVRHLSLSWASPIQSTCPHPTSWRSILILSTHLRLGLPSKLYIHNVFP